MGDTLSIAVGAAVATTSSPLPGNRDTLLSEEVFFIIRVANQRKNTLHQVTARLAKTKSVIVIEDLNVSGMLKNHHLAQAIADVGFYEFKHQVLYKAAWYGSKVVLASRWEPSSKTCSTPGCGWVDEDLLLADRVFRCERCGLVIDRDPNAALNLWRDSQGLSS